MTLDLSSLAHHEALRWACGYAEQNGVADIKAFAVQCKRYPGRTHEHRLAAEALSSPEQSAAIVCALLEGCGVRGIQTFGKPESHRNLTPKAPPGFAYRAGTDAAVCVRLAHESWLDRDVIMPDILALILRLLTCTDRDSALAALREAGR